MPRTLRRKSLKRHRRRAGRAVASVSALLITLATSSLAQLCLPLPGSEHRQPCPTLCHAVQAAAVARTTGSAVADVTKQKVEQAASQASRALETEGQRERWAG